MAGWRTISWLSCMVALAITHPGFADLAAPPGHFAGALPTFHASVLRPAASPTPAAAAELAWLDRVAPANLDAVRQAQADSFAPPSWVDLCPGGPRDGVATASATVNDSLAASAVELPPPPSSAVLTLTGLLTLGAWQLGRSARQLQLGALPDWYHANCPDQIGHVRVFELGTPAFEPCFGFVLASQRTRERPVFELAVPPIPELIPTRAPRSPPR